MIVRKKHLIYIQIFYTLIVFDLNKIWTDIIILI